MSIMYEKILRLCEQRGIKPGRICSDTGLSRGMMTDLKMGRTKALSAKNAKIVAEYLGVSVDYLIGNEEEEKEQPTEQYGELSESKLKLIKRLEDLSEDSIYILSLLAESLE